MTSESNIIFKFQLGLKQTFNVIRFPIFQLKTPLKEETGFPVS